MPNSDMQLKSVTQGTMIVALSWYKNIAQKKAPTKS